MAEKIWPKEPLRGINCTVADILTPSGYLSDKMFKKLSGWNINLIRVFVSVDKHSKWDVEEGKFPPPIPRNDPLLPYRKQLAGFKVALALAEKYHIYIIPVADRVVGRKTSILYSENDDSGVQSTLVELWKYIAREFGKNHWLLAYDLLNEPHSENEVACWQKITFPTLINEIRNIDKETYLVVEPAPWGNVNSLRMLYPVKDRKVVYSFHFYAPHTYTHQGTIENKHTKGKLKYPGKLKMYDSSPQLCWDRNQMMRYIEVAREFQKKYDVRLLVGEFSAIRWAPGAAQWIADAISVFEEYEWDWCYHNYGEWNVWNPTFDADDSTNSNIDGGKDTDRLKVLQKAWSKNRKY